MLTESELLDKVKKEVTLVRGSFKDNEWNRISRNDRLLKGILFINYIKTQKIGVVTAKKTSSEQKKCKKEYNGKGGF